MADYVKHVNLAIDHVTRHYAEPLRLADVARAAGLSTFHFHRVFKLLLGETVGAFIKRVRLERAVTMIARDRARSLTDIALSCGFSSSSDFSRSFKAAYGLPPRAFDVDVFRRTQRGAFVDALTTAQTRHLLERLPPGENPDGFTVALRSLPHRRVAYIRVHRPYEHGNVTAATRRLIAWAREHGFIDRQWLGYTWDDPELVPMDRCRYDVGVEVDDSISAQGEIAVTTFAPMRVAELAVCGPIDLEQRALDWMFGTWLPRSKHVPGEQPCFEAWNSLPWTEGPPTFDLRLQLPVLR